MTVFWVSVHSAEGATSSCQRFPLSGEERTYDHPRPSSRHAPRLRASRIAMATVPLPSGPGNKSPSAARGLQLEPGLASPAPSRARLRPAALT